MNTQIGLHIKTDGTITTVYPKKNRFTLDELQGYVGGLIERTRTKPPVRDMWANEEGYILGLPHNARATALLDPRMYPGGGVVGNTLVVMTAKQHASGKFWPSIAEVMK